MYQVFLLKLVWPVDDACKEFWEDSEVYMWKQGSWTELVHQIYINVFHIDNPYKGTNRGDSGKLSTKHFWWDRNDYDLEQTWAWEF